MSATDLNYGFVDSGGPGGHGGRAVGLHHAHGMDTFAASSSCNDIMIGGSGSSSTAGSSLSPAIFSSRKLLNDAVIIITLLFSKVESYKNGSVPTLLRRIPKLLIKLKSFF